jgi:hypothetical protein
MWAELMRPLRPDSTLRTRFGCRDMIREVAPPVFASVGRDPWIDHRRSRGTHADSLTIRLRKRAINPLYVEVRSGRHGWRDRVAVTTFARTFRAGRAWGSIE